MLFTYLLGFVLVYWVSFALFAYYKVTGIFRKYSKHQQIEVPEKWKGFIRTDFQ